MLVIYQGCSRKFVFRRSERGCKQKYNSAWGTECAGRGAGPCRYIGCAVRCAASSVWRTCTYSHVYTAWHGVRPSVPRPPHSNGCPNQNLYRIHPSRSSPLFLPVYSLFCLVVLLFTHSTLVTLPISFTPPPRRSTPFTSAPPLALNHHSASYSNPCRDSLRKRNAALLPFFHLFLHSSLVSIITILAAASRRISRDRFRPLRSV